MLRSEIKKFVLARNTQVLLASVLWVVLTVGAVAIFVLGTIGLYNGLREPCVMFVSQAREFCVQRQASLAALGISPDTYANFLTAGVIFEILPWIVIGVVIFWRKSDQLLGIFFSLALILLGTIAIDEGVSTWALFYHPWLAPVVMIVQFVGFSCVAVWYVFPDGQFVPRWTRWLALLWVLRTFGFIFLRGTWLDTDRLPDPWNSLPAVFIASFLFSLVYRYYRVSNAAQQRQIKWVVAGATIYGTVYLLRLIPALHAGPTVTPLQLVYVTALYVSSFLFALCLGISMLYSKLFDIDVIVRRTVTYSLVAAVLTIVYFGSVIVLQQVFALVTGQRSEVITVLSTLAIAVLFVPLRDGIHNAIDRRFNRKKYDAQKVLADFATTVRDETDLEALTGRLMDVVKETMQPKSVTVWLKRDMQKQRSTIKHKG